jgi:hypothetical protein
VAEALLFTFPRIRDISEKVRSLTVSDIDNIRACIVKNSPTSRTVDTESIRAVYDAILKKFSILAPAEEEFSPFNGQ